MMPIYHTIHNNYPHMSVYNRVANEFRRVGAPQGALLNQYGLNHILDSIVQTRLNTPQFDRALSQQLFQETPKDSSGRVMVRDYINTIVTAQGIIDQHIKRLQYQLSHPISEQQRSLKLQYIDQYNQEYKLLTIPFGISIQDQHQVDQYLAASRSKIAASRLSNNNSLILTDQPSDRQESSSLKFVLIIATLAFIVELLCMFVRHHFHNSLAYIAVLGIFFLNYFDKSYMRVCLMLLVAAVLLDFFWAFLQAQPYWNHNGQTQHSTLQPFFLALVYLLTIILIFVKILLIILLFRFNNNDENTRKVVRIFVFRFDLDGRHSEISLFN